MTRHAARIPVLLLLVLLAIPLAAWDLEWVEQIGTAGFDAAEDVTVDATGIYVGGITNSAPPGQTSVGRVDAFLRRYDAGGGIVWTRQFGTAGVDFLNGVDSDATGIYVAGSTALAMPGGVQVGQFDLFVRKYDRDGNVLWTRQFGTAAFDDTVPSALAVHSSGVYFTGQTLGTFPGELAGVGWDRFVAKLDPATGNLLWVRQLGMRGVFVFVGGVSADDSGVYLAASKLDAVQAVAVLRKYDSDGNAIWTRTLVGEPLCGAFFWDVAAYAGQLYVAGQWNEKYAEDPASCNSSLSHVVGVLQAYDTDGTEVWKRIIKANSQTGAGDGFTGAKRVWASADGVYVGANATVNFPGRSPDAPRLDHSACPGVDGQGTSFANRLDAYVRRYTYDGDVVWTHQFGSPVFDLVTAISTFDNRVYATGISDCRIDEQETFAGGFQDGFAVTMSATPSSPEGRVQLIVGQVETLSDRGAFNPGDFGSLIQQLEAVIADLAKGQTANAVQSLEVFIGKVEGLRERGVLTAAAAAAISATAHGIIADL